jgi:hypothetical protein
MFPASNVVSVSNDGRNKTKQNSAVFCREQHYLPVPTVMSPSSAKQKVLEHVASG